MPTSVVLYLLRPYRRFWLALSSAALAIAATGLASAIIYAIGRTASGGLPLGEWAGLATLRILVAPICALGFAVSGLVAPTRAPRIALFVATGIDAAVFAYAVMTWTRIA